MAPTMVDYGSLAYTTHARYGLSLTDIRGRQVSLGHGLKEKL